MMARRQSRTQRCSKAEARRRLDHAEKFLEVAELAVSEPDWGNASASSAVLAGIAAADAACCHDLGKRSRAEDHHEAERLLSRIEPGGKEAARRLSRLLDLKDGAQYGFIDISGAALKRVLRDARALTKFANRILHRSAATRAGI
jgi:hypothetical protein